MAVPPEEPEYLLPHNLDAERAVLGGILIDNSLFTKAREILRAADFYRDGHRSAFKAMERLAARGEGIDLITLNAELDREGKLDLVGGEVKGIPLSGSAYISVLVDGVPRSSNVEHYAGIVKEKSWRRNVVARSEAARNCALNGSTPEEMGAVLARAVEVFTSPSVERPTPLLAMDIAAALTSEPVPPPWMVPTWMARGDVVCLAAEPKMMKSWIALDLAFALATSAKFLQSMQITEGPYRVLYVDEENNPRLVERRLRKLARGLGMKPEIPASLPLRYLVGNHFNLDDAVRREAFLREVATFGPDLVILDSLVRFHRRDENSNSEMSAFAADVLKPISATYGSAVLALHHLGKPGPSRAAGDLGHRVRGASDILAFVDALWTLERDGEGTTTLRHENGRWDETGEAQRVILADLEDGEAIRLSAEPIEATAKEAVRDALLFAERVGVLRQEIVALLKQTDPKNADKQATRHLGRLYAAQRARRKKEGNGTRYWLTQFAPEDAT